MQTGKNPGAREGRNHSVSSNAGCTGLRGADEDMKTHCNCIPCDQEAGAEQGIKKTQTEPPDTETAMHDKNGKAAWKQTMSYVRTSVSLCRYERVGHKEYWMQQRLRTACIRENSNS